MGKASKTPPAKVKFVALTPNEAGLIEPVEIRVGEEGVTFREVRENIYRSAREVAQWAREALNETPQNQENELWRQGLIWIGELSADVMGIVNSGAINTPGTVLDRDIIENIYGLAMACSLLGRYHQLAELADVLTAEQLQRKTLLMVSDLQAALAAHGAKATAKLDVIQERSKGVQVMVEREQIESVKNYHNIMSQVKFLFQLKIKLI